MDMIKLMLKQLGNCWIKSVRSNAQSHGKANKQVNGHVRMHTCTERGHKEFERGRGRSKNNH